MPYNMRLICLFLALLSVITINGADLRGDIRDFINLIPRNRVAFLAGRHMLFDGKFRSAFNYLRSSNFAVLMRDEVSNNQQVQDVIKYLGRDIDLNRIPAVFGKAVIRMRPSEEYGRVRTLASFVREVADILPNDKITKLIREKSAANPEFAMLYKRVTDPQFKLLVYKARNSKSLAGAIKTLRNNQVDVDQLLEISFQQLNKWSNVGH